MTPGAEVQLLNSTGNGDEGQEISVCAQLTSVQGGLTRPLSITTMILSGTADSKIACGIIILLSIHTCTCVR